MPGRASRFLADLPHIWKRGLTPGYCPLCEGPTVFIKEGTWLRDQLLCLRCRSIPRFRALIAVLEDLFPNWRDLAIHESSPSGVSSAKIASESRNYVGTYWFPEIPLGTMHRDYRCENLEHQTFPDGSFDLVITQDVFEHVLDPARAFGDIARTLKPSGVHLFTVPWYYWKPTFVRAVKDGEGVRHLADPDYHVNPADPKGSLVVTEWGEDFCDFVERASGMPTTVVRMFDRHRGIEGEFLDVFVSQKIPQS